MLIHFFFSLIMIDLPHVEDFVLQLEKKCKAKEGKVQEVSKHRVADSTNYQPRFFWFKYLPTLILSMPGWDFTDYDNYVLSFLPHFALLLLYSVGVGSPDRIFYWWECVVCSHMGILFPTLSPSALFPL